MVKRSSVRGSAQATVVRAASKDFMRQHGAEVDARPLKGLTYGDKGGNFGVGLGVAGGTIRNYDDYDLVSIIDYDGLFLSTFPALYKLTGTGNVLPNHRYLQGGYAWWLVGFAVSVDLTAVAERAPNSSFFGTAFRSSALETGLLVTPPGASVQLIETGSMRE